MPERRTESPPEFRARPHAFPISRILGRSGLNQISDEPIVRRTDPAARKIGLPDRECMIRLEISGNFDGLCLALH
jgi:hypothetical protein